VRAKRRDDVSPAPAAGAVWAGDLGSAHIGGETGWES